MISGTRQLLQSISTIRRGLATDGAIPKALLLTRQHEYASIRWLEKSKNKANRCVLQLRRHIDDAT